MCLTASENARSGSDWIQCAEAHRIIERLRRIFPLSPDSSIRRAGVRAYLSHEPGASEDTLVVDAVHQLYQDEA